MTRIRKIHIWIPISSKEANDHYSVQQEVKTGREPAQPHLCWNRTLDQGKHKGQCWEGVVWWAEVGQSPHLLSLCLQDHTYIQMPAAEREVWASEVTKWEREQILHHLVSHRATVSHFLSERRIRALGTVTVCSLHVNPSFFT